MDKISNVHCDLKFLIIKCTSDSVIFKRKLSSDWQHIQDDEDADEV